jgi:hypothetical protein
MFPWVESCLATCMERPLHTLECLFRDSVKSGRGEPLVPLKPQYLHALTPQWATLPGIHLEILRWSSTGHSGLFRLSFTWASGGAGNGGEGVHALLLTSLLPDPTTDAWPVAVGDDHLQKEVQKWRQKLEPPPAPLFLSLLPAAVQAAALPHNFKTTPNPPVFLRFWKTLAPGFLSTRVCPGLIWEEGASSWS